MLKRDLAKCEEIAGSMELDVDEKELLRSLVRRFVNMIKGQSQIIMGSDSDANKAFASMLTLGVTFRNLVLLMNEAVEKSPKVNEAFGQFLRWAVEDSGRRLEDLDSNLPTDEEG